MKILIDGYNLIFECGLHGKNVNPHSLARARDRLINTLASVFADQRHEIVVVFDAQQQVFSGQPEQETSAGIRVLYSVHYPEADDLIEHLIRQHSSPKSLTVVSNDHRLHKAASKRKATAIDSDVWWDQITSIGPPLPRDKNLGNPKSDSGELLSQADMDLFLSDLSEELDDPDKGWPPNP